MNDSVISIPLQQLAIAFIPVIAVVFILQRWSHQDAATTLYAMARMLGQLLLIGYFLNYLFETDDPGTIVAIILVMIFASSWIALRTVSEDRAGLYWQAWLAIAIGGSITLFTVIYGVLAIEPWYQPRFAIPLAGMVYANAMNAVSLAADRLKAECCRGEAWENARNAAFNAAMIPNINMLFAVGLVSLPGMMTGQILSGVSPLIAVRYQIMVMCMIFAAAGLASALFLQLARRRRWHSET